MSLLDSQKGQRHHLHLIDKNFLTPIEVVGRNGFSFCNYFVANSSFWRRYFNFVDQVLQYLEGQANADSEFNGSFIENWERTWKA